MDTDFLSSPTVNDCPVIQPEIRVGANSRRQCAALLCFLPLLLIFLSLTVPRDLYAAPVPFEAGVELALEADDSPNDPKNFLSAAMHTWITGSDICSEMLRFAADIRFQNKFYTRYSLPDKRGPPPLV